MNMYFVCREVATEHLGNILVLFYWCEKMEKYGNWLLFDSFRFDGNLDVSQIWFPHWMSFEWYPLSILDIHLVTLIFIEHPRHLLSDWHSLHVLYIHWVTLTFIACPWHSLHVLGIHWVTDIHCMSLAFIEWPWHSLHVLYIHCTALTFIEWPWHYRMSFIHWAFLKPFGLH
jgi:hypothetical protein